MVAIKTFFCKRCNFGLKMQTNPKCGKLLNAFYLFPHLLLQLDKGNINLFCSTSFKKIIEITCYTGYVLDKCKHNIKLKSKTIKWFPYGLLIPLEFIRQKIRYFAEILRF